jgi:hypothetical protein
MMPDFKSLQALGGYSAKNGTPASSTENLHVQPLKMYDLPRAYEKTEMT